MQVEVTGETAEIIQEFLAEGRFGSAEEAVECAVRFLRFDRRLPFATETRDELEARLARSQQQADEGDMVELSDEFFDALRARIRTKARLQP